MGKSLLGLENSGYLSLSLHPYMYVCIYLLLSPLTLYPSGNPSSNFFKTTAHHPALWPGLVHQHPLPGAVQHRDPSLVSSACPLSTVIPEYTLEIPKSCHYYVQNPLRTSHLPPNRNPSLFIIDIPLPTSHTLFNSWFPASGPLQLQPPSLECSSSSFLDSWFPPLLQSLPLMTASH